MLIFPVCLLLLAAACAKNNLPLAPRPAPPAPTPVANPAADETTLVVQTLAGSAPLPNLTCSLTLAGGSPVTRVSDAAGKITFTQKAAGDYTVAVPAQGDILDSVLSGTVHLGQSKTVVFQTEGGALGVTPTVIQYSQAGGDFPIFIDYQKGAATLRTRLSPSVLNLPGSWAADFSDSALVCGAGNTLTVRVPAGSQVNAVDLIVSGQALNRRQTLQSSGFAIGKDWAESADVRVLVKNGGVVMSGIKFTVTDAQGRAYSGATTSEAAGTNVHLLAVGPYSVFVPTQGSLHDNQKSGYANQGETKTVAFEVGNANITVKVNHEGEPWRSLSVKVTDTNGIVQNGVTDTSGSCSFHMTAVGAYTIEIPPNAAQGIASSVLNRFISQDQTLTVAVNGKPGTLALADANYGYPYAGGTHNVSIHYVKDGDINYILNLDCEGYAHPDTGITKSFSPGAAVSGSDPWRTLIETIPAGKNWQSDTLRIVGTKGGDHPITIPSGYFYLHRDWSISIHAINDPVQMTLTSGYDYAAACFIRVTGENVPDGTPVYVQWSYTMPQQVWRPSPWNAWSIYLGGVNASASPFNTTVGHMTPVIINGLNRRGEQSSQWYTDGTVAFDAYIGSVGAHKSIGLTY